MIQNKCHSLLHVVLAFIGTIVSKTLLFWYSTLAVILPLFCATTNHPLSPVSLSRLSPVSASCLSRVSLVSRHSLSLSLSLSLLKIKEKFCSKFSPSPHIKPKKNLLSPASSGNFVEIKILFTRHTFNLVPFRPITIVTEGTCFKSYTNSVTNIFS